MDEVVDAYCSTIRSCCLGAGFPAGPLASCEAEVSEFDSFRAVLSGKAVFREPERLECIAWIEALAETCVQPDDSPCQLIYEGTSSEGGPCENAVECRRGVEGVACFRVRVGDEDPPSGTCRALTVGQAGSPCFQTIDTDDYAVTYTTDDANSPLGVCDVRDGLYCDYTTETCQPLAGAGQPCDFLGCAEGLFCDETCQPRVAAGAACESFDQCQGDLGCVHGVCAVRKLTDGDLCEGDFD